MYRFFVDICFMPEDAGQCQESVPKWRYDRRDGACRQFVFSGCGGNRNNFDRREDCEQTCTNVQGEGTLRALHPRRFAECDPAL